MRLLRELDEEGTAQTLADALWEQGIECDVRRASETASSVWVRDELDLERARRLSDEWLEAEDHGPLLGAAKRGRAARDREQRQQEQALRMAERAQEVVAALGTPRPTPVTYALIALCVVVFMALQNAETRSVESILWIQNPRAIPVTLVRWGGIGFHWLGLPWTEPWRLLTPILVHADVLHIVFNMLWLHGLGSVLERRHGSLYLLAFVGLSGVLSNVAQYEIAHSPAFGGMSGVVYGMLGLIWLRGRRDPAAGYAISSFTVQFMLIWLVLGFVAPGMHAANWCHLGGLLVGCAWGALAPAERA